MGFEANHEMRTIADALGGAVSPSQVEFIVKGIENVPSLNLWSLMASIAISQKRIADTLDKQLDHQQMLFELSERQKHER